MMTNISIQNTPQIKNLVETLNAKPDANLQKISNSKQQFGTINQITSVSISDNTRANIDKLTNSLVQIKKEQQDLEMAASTLGLLRDLSRPIKSCNCSAASQNDTNLKTTDGIKVASSIKSNTNIETVPRNANKIDQVTIDIDSAKFTGTTTIDTQTAGKFANQDINGKSSIEQSLNTINIDLPPNLGELKNQILAEARSSLVDQAPRQYSLVQALLKP